MDPLGSAGSGQDAQGGRASSFPLSPAQLGMWFAQHVDPSVPANIAQYVELRGALDIDLLQRVSSEAALEMQSGFVRIVEVDAEPRQFVDPTLDDELGYLDLRGEDNPRAVAHAWMRADYSAPIDMLTDRLIAATVLHLEDDLFFWYERVHHVVLDGFGAVTFMNRVAELYTAAANGTEPKKNLSSDLTKVYDLDVAYRDSTRFETDREYWADRVAGIETVTSLAGRSAAPAPVSQIDTTALSALHAARIEDLTTATGSTLASVVISAFAAYLAQMTGREDVVLSLPVTARTTAVLRRSGGMVSNVVPLRLDVSRDTTVEELLARIGTEVTGALRHQRYRHEDIRRDAGGAGGQASFFGPWVNIMLFFSELRFGSMVGGINILSTGLIEDFGLNLYQSVAGSTTHVDFESNPNLYDSEESARNHARFIDFLDRFVAAGPSARVWDLELATADERSSVLEIWNETEHELVQRTLLSDYHARVDLDPESTALVYEGLSLTYGELGSRVSGLARMLIAKGVGPETLVGLSIRRSLDLIVAMYAIVEAGGAWVPLDPDHPADRTAYILDSAQPLCVLVVSRDGVELPDGTDTVQVDLLDYAALNSARVQERDLLSPLRLDNTAYVIYTSGSTGRPKGVAVTHAAIDNQLQWMRSEYELDATDVYLQKTATTFDVSLWGFFLPLQVGATMVLATPDGHRDSVYVADKIAEHSVTVTDFVPSMLTVFVANAPIGTCGSLRHVFVIGEALPVETAAAFRELTDAGLHNLYGPTEAAVSVTYYESGVQDERTVPIGVPEWNTRALVLDGLLRPSPIGESGELYLAGVQLARGYVGRPDLSSDRFVANPFGSAGERMYRTGDLVRWRADGTIDYIGRTDFQVKFRGQRIELGEIETVLLAHQSISQAVALVVPTATGEQLVAYVVPGPGATVDAAEGAEFASRSLPSYMVPSAIVVLDALPLNTSGKLDRKALPEPVFSSAKKYRAPQTRVEYVVAGVFEDVLGASHVGLDEDFFELGGNSLIATQLVTRVGTALGIRLGVRELFEAPTVGALASRAETAIEQGSAGPPLTAGPRPDVLPLSLAQQRMWFLNRFDPDTAAYNLPFMVRLTGDVNEVALSQAFADVVARHETLRTVYPQVDDAPQQLILRTEDVLSELSAASVDETSLVTELVEFARGGFDVAVAAPIRIALFKISDYEYVLAMVLHHIAADGSSFGPLARDMMAAYEARSNGRAPAWAPLPIQYADYALWQRRLLGLESDSASLSAQQIEFWVQALDELPDQLDLPSDRPRPSVATNGGAKSRFTIDARIHRGLTTVARAHQASLFMVVQAAYAVLLSRLSGTTDIAIGAPIAGRAHEQLDDIIGMFVNTLVLRARVEPHDSFDDLLDQVRNTNLSAFAHADIPFERLVEVLNPARSTARHPLFQVALSLEKARVSELSFAGLQVTAQELDVPIAKFDLQLWLTEHQDDSGEPGRIEATFEYATDLFDASTIEGFADRFLRILEAIVADASVPLGVIDILAPDESETLTTIHGGRVESRRLLPEFLAAGVAVNPDGIAVHTSEETVTYRELDELTDRYARYLIDRGVGPESVVALAFPRSLEMVISMWAVAKAGAAWVPVDPEYPTDRVRHMLSDSGALVGITSSTRVDELPGTCEWWAIDNAEFEEAVAGYPADGVSDEDRTAPLRLDHPAYIIYTSGSTGLPKGVSVTHRGLSGLIDQSVDLYRVTPASRFLHVISPSFDPSVLEWALTASAGATLVVAPPSIIGGPELHRLLADVAVTHAIITPAVLGSVDPVGLDDLELLSVGGEASAADLIARWAPGRRFFNAYGPTETTIVSTRGELFVGEPITVGRPVPGVGALILDSRLQPVPAGVAGELYLSGDAVARGYFKRAGLTSDRFVADPYSNAGTRMYRTGDIVRWTKDFAIEYVGRSDFQVKVRGFRIELGEIDAALETFPAVTFAATLGREIQSGQTALVSYVHGSVSIDKDELSKHVGRLLPNYMVPSVIVVLDEVPLTPIGKLDRRALPEPELGISFRQFRAPTTPIEETVATVFSDVLGVPVVGLDDDFFELGGNSLLATQVVSRLGVALDASVPVRMVFEASSVALLAVRVEQSAGEGGRIPLVASTRPDQVPLSLAQQRMWFLNRFDTDSTAYNIPFALRLTGELDVAALQVAIMDVIDRHESLRTVYPDTVDGPRQCILDAAQTVPSLMPIQTSAADIQRQVFALASTTFDVTVNVPIQARLFEIGPREHVVAMVVHHISADGWSMGPLARDIMIAYAARTAWEHPAWLPLAVQYADYSLWQRSVLGSEKDSTSLISSQVHYWADMLAGLPDQLDLPTDHPRPSRQSYKGSSVRFEIPAHMHRELSLLALAHNASLFMVVHGALAVLLSRLSGTSDIAIGTPVAGRGDAALDDVVGMFVNTLVLRTDVDASTSFSEQIGRAREVALGAFGHADLPFERLVEVLNPTRSQARHPLFQVMLSFENLTRTHVDLPGLSVDSVALDAEVAKFDLQLNVVESIGDDGRGQGMSAEFTYAIDLFDAETVRSFASRFVRVLEAVVADSSVAVGDIDLLDIGERKRVVSTWNRTRHDVAPGLTLVDLFDRQVEATPEASALVYEDERLTYSEFDSRVNRLARHLISIGVGPDMLVGLAIGRSVELLVGMYAIVKAGAGYVPIDPTQPTERNEYIIATASPVCVLSTMRDHLDLGVIDVIDIDDLNVDGYSNAAVSDDDRLCPLRESNTAYVIFTSGSTGRPKGVAVAHSAIVNRLLWMQNEYPIDAADVVLQKTPSTFDVSVWEFFWALQNGASVVVAAPDGHRDAAYLLELVQREQVSVAHFVPSMLAVFVPEVEVRRAAGSSLRLVFASGEALAPTTAQSLRRALPRVALHNLYGPTEAAVDVTYHPVSDVDTVVMPIGMPVWNTSVFVLDARLSPVPVGVAGELYLAGAQLARGYVGRPDLSADRFVANPFAQSGNRMYRTGDVVRWNRGGELEYIGRSDSQVKLRGLRIELGEIEAVLLENTSIQQAAVSVRGEQLVAYVVTAPDTDLRPVREMLASRLAEYMVPSVFMPLTEFPLGATGKLDRRALPDPVYVQREYREPVSPTEQAVASVFAEVLDATEVGLDDDFFELGGNSLIATRVVTRLGAALDAEIGVRTLFENPSVAALARAIAERAGAGRRRPLVPQVRPELVPLSLAQQRMWFLNRFDTASGVNNIPVAVRLSGLLDRQALNVAVADVLDRHESLRTIFPEVDGSGHQLILPTNKVIPDLAPIEISGDDIFSVLEEVATTGFDVTVELPLRARLFEISPTEHLLVLVVHHISTDGFSMGPLTRDIMTAYIARSEGVQPNWLPLPVQYADYSLWQRDMLGHESDPESLLTQQQNYWKSALAGIPAQLDLPVDHPRPAVASNQGAGVSFLVGQSTVDVLTDLAHHHASSLFMVMHSAFAVLLARLSGTEDIVVGTPVAGRGESALDDLIGMFVNTLVLRTPVDMRARFDEVLAATRTTDLQAFANADVPFERLVEVLNPARSQARHPLFQVMLSFQNMELTDLELPGLSVSMVDFETKGSKFDLQLTISQKTDEHGTDAGLSCLFTYATDLFDAATVEAMAARFQRILRAIEVDPAIIVGDIDFQAPEEYNRLVRTVNDTEHAVDDTETLASLFDAQVGRTPNAPALVLASETDAPSPVLTYAEFDARANALARYLVGRGVGPESTVALVARRSFELLIGMYAIIKSGAAYVPLDPDQPASRNEHILASARPVLVLATEDTANSITADAPVCVFDKLDLDDVSTSAITDADRTRPLRPDNPAYLIFTSGSTGLPKGVSISHRAIVNQMLWRQEIYRLTAADVLIQKTPATFDVSVWEFFWGLENGASLVIAPHDAHRDPGRITRIIEREQVTLAHFVPSVLSVYVTDVDTDACRSLRLLFVGGEAFTPSAVARVRRVFPGAELHDLYGPAETAVDVTFHAVTDVDTETVPIGVPLWNTRAYVLDQRLHSVPAGVLGELYIGGVQLARGYASRADLTAERFVADPFGENGARLYRTGDVVRWNSAGELEYVGRSDFQVKLRGQRVELGEIESSVRAGAENVDDAVVVVHSDARAGDRLIAYVVPRPGHGVDTDALRAAVKMSLPSYMVPSVFVTLDAFPLNASGKLDRHALPVPSAEVVQFRAPVTPIEEIVAQVFTNVLGTARVGLDDDFFELGGNSLVAMQLVSRLGTALDSSVGVRELFENSTVGALAASVERKAGTGGRKALGPQNRPALIPLSLAQQRMWFLNRFDPESAVNNIPAAIKLTGALDVAALAAAVGDLTSRHESLRTVYPDHDGSGYQKILSVGEVTLDLTPVDVSEDDLPTRMYELAATGFDVTLHVPFRTQLFRIGTHEHVLMFVAHHIAADGFSMAPLARDVMTAYVARSEGHEPGWPMLEVHYADFAIWQREVLGSESDPGSLLAQQETFWRDALAGLPDEVTLPTDRPRGETASGHGAVVSFDVTADVHRRLSALARDNNASLFMVVHSAVAVMLARMSATDDIAIGTPIAGRGDAALDDVIGMFVNTLVLRTDVDAASTFRELLVTAREVDLAAFAHSDIPFERLVEVLNPERSQARHPLVQVLLAFQNIRRTGFDLPGLTVAPVDVDAATARADLQLTVTESAAVDGTPDGLRVFWTYATDLYDRATVEEFGARLLRVLDAVVEDEHIVIGEIDLLGAEERVRVTSTWAGVDGIDPSVSTLAEMFDQQVLRSPQSCAVVFGEERLSYRELDDRSNRLARHLMSTGVGPESLVAVALPRSVDLVVTLLAVIKAGGGYVPVDPTNPADRIAYVLADAAPTALVTWSGREFSVPAGLGCVEIDAVDLSVFGSAAVDDVERARPLRPTDVAYVIYTSGSTGRPKGVVVPHVAVARLMANTDGLFEFDSSDVWTLFHSYAFDFSVWELWGPLLHGGTLVVVDYFTSRSPEAFRELLIRENVTVLNQTPSAFYQLAAVDRVSTASEGSLQLRYVIFGGEALELRRLSDWFDRHGENGPELVNMYGITETTVHVSHRRIDRELVSSATGSVVGAAIPGLRVYVLDSRLAPVPVGVAGEMYVAGGTLARGYLGRTDLTATRFLANPFSGTAAHASGSLMYRTGDVARWTIDGDLEFVGRADDQVKIRGFRIELGEIESALSSQDPVGQVAVVLRTDRHDTHQLVAYLVPVVGSSIDVQKLRTEVAAVLPEYMIPSAFVVVSEIPLTVNGKLDRRALPEPVFEVREFKAPTTPIEEIVAEIFADLLGVDRVGVDDDFFELGGNSLIATRVVSRIGAAVDSVVPVRALFESRTVERLALEVERSGKSGRVALVARTRPNEIPLSLSQRRMWFLNRFDPTSTAYLVPFALRLSGELDVAALGAAVADLISRHESLRTVYPESENGPVQKILHPSRSIPELPVSDVAPDALSEHIASLASTQFDVTTEVPMRIELYRTSATEHVLAMVAHHISVDGVSVGPLARDLMTAYAARATGTEPGWTPLPVQYADFSLWQSDVLGSEEDANSTAAQQISYWTDALADLPDELTLPSDRARPATQSFAGGSVEFEIDAELHEGLRDLARKQGGTLFMAVHAAFAGLLSRLSGTGDIAVGTPIAGRGDRALDDLIGMFVNTLVLRTHVDGALPFAELIDRAREADLGAFANADVPFERLVEVLNPVRSTARHPLFQVGFSFQNQGVTEVALPGLDIAALDIESGVAQFDLHLIVVDRYSESGVPAGMSAEFTYAKDLFDHTTVSTIATRFVRLLESVVERPDARIGDIDLLGIAERELVLESWNSTDHSVHSEATLVSLFDEQVAIRPDSTAVVEGDQRWTFHEFDSRVNRLARYLIARGVGPETLTALAIRRSADLVVAMFAVAKTGGAYVPLDPDQPLERVEYILETAGPVLLLSKSSDGSRFSDHSVLDIPMADIAGLDLSVHSDAPITDAERAAPLRAGNSAYVIFTSGSTGRPKGVAVSHAAIANQLMWKRTEFDLGSQDSILLKTSATFDLSVWEFWSAPTSGATLVIAGPDEHRDPARVNDIIRKESITTLHVVPSMLTALMVDGDGVLPPSLKRVLAIGEALPGDTARRFVEHNEGALFNLYGPTEAAVSVTSHRVRSDESARVPIGRPEWNTQAYVLDTRLHPVPAGTIGELYLAGKQLARGYLGRPDLTADRFVANPFDPSGGRLYRSGDLAFWDVHGELVFAGRSDFQVKIRGFRIELGEIEAAMRALNTLADSAVIMHSDALTGDRLVGYLVPSESRTIDIDEVRTALGTSLPSYMVPSHFVVLTSLPLNANGKLDRAALPAPVFESTEFRAPTDPVEQIVARVYSELLGVARVGLDDDFFALGGNSLVATQLVARLGAALNASIPVRSVFEAPTVGALAARVESHVGQGARVPLIARPRPESVSLSLAQQRMWTLNQVDRTSDAYNIPVAIRLTGALDVTALRAAVGDLFRRHEILRTRYPDTDHGPVQSVVPMSEVLPGLEVRKISAAEVPVVVGDVVTAGFDVAARVPVRAELFSISETNESEFVLVFVAHHISADGFSMRPLIRDVMTAYIARTAGDAPLWTELPVQYADYALWQREVLGSEDDPDSVLSKQIDYWAETLVGAPEQIALPTDFPRPARASLRGGRSEFTVPSDIAARVQKTAREHNATVFMVVHGALAVLLSKLSGDQDITVGTPVAGRGDAALDDLVGMFVNTLVLRTKVSPSTTFADLLTEVRETDLSAFAHADVPFERVVEVAGHKRSAAYSPLFQVMLTFQNLATGTFALPGLKVSALESGLEQAKVDLQLTAVERFDESGDLTGIDAVFNYATSLFESKTIELFAQRFTRVLDLLTSDPSSVIRAVDIRSEAERAGPAPKPKTIDDLPELVSAAAAVAASSIALSHAGTSVTFGQLDEKLSAVSKSTGGALKPEAVLSVALTGLLPGILPALGADGFAATVASLISDAQAFIADPGGPGVTMQ
ncbi:non-ribosomal peptide synthase/polyketide synthase [Rhodococcus sp. H36-A4]|uniref:non-ribosomal peptide synthase/polyketide synthase n=1 Tax=Rhodococcus sp. H36-A4 TaxID=3004353 RepID=UPI0022AEDB66|nr:non-ribosomal peptide synthase/polyketide synthase [Rhodococcus sp. H36-A4]MCZ4076318.1 non-ribosomal peptide synthase/polyketide synthase [Rhodococcus sp. H36-A4]